MKRRVTKSEWEFLEGELAHFKDKGLIEEQQAKQMMANYEVKAKISFVQVLLTIGALLVGAGILSFIAGNWSQVSNPVKLILIISGLIALYVAGWKTEGTRPYTSRSLYYLGVFMSGAGIFLIGQIYHLDGDYHDASFLWLIGTLPLAIYLRDKWLFLFSMILTLVYGFDAWNPYASYPYGLLVLVPLYFWVNEKVMNRSKWLFLLNNFLTLFTVFSFMIRLNMDARLVPIVFFVFGILMVAFPSHYYRKAMEWTGSIIYGVSGLFLTFSEYWDEWETLPMPNVFAFASMLVLISLLVIMLRRGSLPAILVSCGFVIRLYVDLSYDFMPKSMFFILGGLILIGFGYWFEMKRRKGGEKVE